MRFGIFDAVDLNERILAFIRIFLDVDDFIAINKEHLIGRFFALLLRCFFRGELCGNGGYSFPFGQIDFGHIRALALNAEKRIFIFNISYGISATPGQKGDD